MQHFMLKFVSTGDLHTKKNKVQVFCDVTLYSRGLESFRNTVLSTSNLVNQGIFWVDVVAVIL
jgi:hypothetical protein